MTSFLFKHASTAFELINYGTTKDIYFKAKDVATFLQYKNTNQAIKDHIWNSNKFTTGTCPRDLIPQNNKFNTIYINEAGLYQLIFASKMDIAQKFQEWVFTTVLPQIRKVGKYQYNNHSVKSNLTFSILNEYDLQKQIINFIKVKYIHALLTVCNGELQNDTQEKRIKSYNMGYEAGSFDIIINNLHQKFNGFAIELKTPNSKGVVSDKQLNIQTKYEMNNFKTLISNDYNEIIFQIIDYMNNTRIKCLYCNRKFKNTNTLNSHLKYFHKINI